MTAPHPQTRYRRLMAKKRPDETLRSLAQRHGVKPRTFYHWHQRYKALEPEAETEVEPAGDDEEPSLLPVELSSTAGQELSSLLTPSFEVALRRSGHVVRVPARFDSTSLERLVAVLERE